MTALTTTQQAADWTALDIFLPPAREQRESWRSMSPAERMGHIISRADRRLERAGLPRRVDREATWDFAAWDLGIVNQARAWALADTLGTLVLDGPIGVGKTSLACLLARLVAGRRDCKLVRYVQSGALVQSLGDHEAPADIREADLLVLDDLGRGHDGCFPSAKSRLWTLLDYRHSEGLPVLFTTNLEGHVEEFRRLLGHEADAMISRLGDKANARILVTANGGDQRRLREVS